MNKQLIAKLALVAMAAGAVAAQATTVSPAPTFKVTMTITSTCAVTTPGDISLGSVVAQTTAVTQTGNTTFKVNCSKGTAFYIGLAPSNASTAGAGTMSGAIVGNTDKVPYTLYSDSGYSTVWGNTATSSAVGNGKSGTGLGMASANAVSFTAYAKATNADFTPDTYTDTVTVNVNY